VAVNASAAQSVLAFSLAPILGEWTLDNFTSWVEISTPVTVNISVPYFDDSTNTTENVTTPYTYYVNSTVPNPLYVWDILVPPDVNDRHFIVIGSRDPDGLSSVTLVHLDFDGLDVTECQNPTEPGTNSSDYELWTPLELQGVCLLGQSTAYLRKKPTSACFDALPEHNETIAISCLCVRADYECDYGYTLVANASCVRDPSVTLNNTPCTPGQPYSVTQGYRKVAGDMCVNGLNLNPTTATCPIPTPVTPGVVERVVSAIKANPGTVAGSVIGSVAGVIIITFAVVMLVQWRRNRNLRYRKNNLDAADNSTL